MSALPEDSILNILREGQIGDEYAVMRWSSNYTFLLEIQHDEGPTMVVYKPQRGERPLWDFPDGTLCYREVASFETSRLLGWQIVPPTVLREGPQGLGSFQLYIEHDPQVNYFSLTETTAPQLLRIAAFDHLVNNADRKGGHCLLDPDNHLWGIDHGITFNVEHKLRTVIWDFAGQAIPDPLLADIERLCEQVDDTKSEYRHNLDSLLHPHEISAFHRRIQKLLHSGCFPRPGRGPNYPWPPV